MEPTGLQDLGARMRRFRVPARCYALLAIPPALILAVLVCIKVLASPVFAPNRFGVGVLFGCVAGFFEEIGWTGYAFPKMLRRRGPFSASVVLGLLWGIWHFPVVDYLGAATPHGSYWPRFFLAFVALVTAIRVLIGWLYVNTQSVLLAQMMHASSTGSLVVFGPARVTAFEEALWYAVYALGLWIVVAVVVVRWGTHLSRRHS